MKRIINALLVVVTILSMLCFTADAASFPSINSNKMLKAYTISSGNNTTVYSDAKLTRKTGTVYASDLLYITQIGTNSKGALYISGTYPLDRGGRKTFYAPASIITTASQFNGSYTTSRGQLTAYRRPGSSQTAGTVWEGDRVYKMDVSGNYTQILFNLGSASNITGWRLGWISTSNYNKYIAKQSTSSSKNNKTTSTSNFTVLQQRDYASIPYEYVNGDGRNISTSGCGVVTLSNAIRWLNCNYSASSNYDLISKMAVAVKKAGARASSGTSVGTMVKSSSVQNTFGFKFHSVVALSNRSKINQTLNGKTVGILGMSNKYLNGGSGAHVVGVIDYDESSDKFLMMDSFMTSSHKYNKNGSTAFWIPASKIDCNNIYFISKR